MIFNTVVLAGGASTRFFPFSEKRKAGFVLMGKPLPWFTLRDISTLGISSAIFVRSKENIGLEEVIGKKVGKMGVKFAVQDKPKGQADALLTVWKVISSRQPVLMMNAHHFTASSVIPKIIEKFEETGKSVVVATKTDKPWKYGIVSTEGDKVTGIIEKPKRGENQSNLRVVGIYFLTLEAIEVISGRPEAEYQLEDGLNELAKKGKLTYLETDQPMPTLKYPWDLFTVKDMLLRGKQFIDKSAFVHKTAVIEGPCRIGPKVVVGAYCLVRGGVILEEGAELQRFVDAKNVIVGRGSHIHSGFVANSVIGESCRLAAGFVTANRRFDRKSVGVEVKGEIVDSGSSYLGAFIGDESQLGIHCGTMPGTVIGPKCTIWPGLMVKGTIPTETIVKTGDKDYVV